MRCRRYAVAPGDDAQCFDEGGTTAEALFRALGERARQYQIQFAGLLRVDRRRRRWQRLYVCNDQLRCGAGEGHHAGDHFIGGDCKRVEIAAPINTLRRRLFGRDILRGAHEHAGAGEAFAAPFGRLGNAEVGQQDTPFDVDQNIVRFDVAMDGALGMRMVESSGNRCHDTDGNGQAKCATFVNDGVQCAATHILHRNVAQAVRLADVIHCDDVGVAKIGNRDRFAFEAARKLGIKREVWRQHLEGDGSLQRRIKRAIDARHAAAPDLFLHQVAAKLLADELSHRFPRTPPAL